MMVGRAMISCCGTSLDLQLEREAKAKAEAKERRKYFMLVD